MKIIIFFDNYCKMCKRTASLIKKLDWLNLIHTHPLRDFLAQKNTLGIDENLALQQIPSYNHQWQYGYATLFEIMKRLPLFWIFLPFLWILKISGIGQFLYLKLAIQRHIIPIQCNANCPTPSK